MGACRLGRRGSILLILITTAAILWPTLSDAEEPVQKTARLGFVGPESPSATVRGISAFWDRLRELGWVDLTGS